MKTKNQISESTGFYWQELEKKCFSDLIDDLGHIFGEYVVEEAEPNKIVILLNENFDDLPVETANIFKATIKDIWGYLVWDNKVTIIKIPK